jgi:S1-C subfamily serine protease
MYTSIKLAGIVALVAGLMLVRTVRADYVELTDGSVVEGTVLKTGDGYWVKTKDGETRKLKTAEVKSTGKGSRPAAKSAAPPPAGAAVPRSTDYTSAERRANAVETPMAAVTIWQEFLDTKPTGDDLVRAKAELAKWQKLADDGAEKIKGKWVGGDERKQIKEKARSLYLEGARLLQGNQTLQAVDKFKESVGVYPNNFHANFLLGYIMMIQRKPKDAQQYFEAAQRIRPSSPEVTANLGLLEIINKKQHMKGIEMLHKAAQQGDSKPIVQDLLNAIATAPPAAMRSDKVKPALEAARLLAAKHGLSPTSDFVIVPLPIEEARNADKDNPLGAGMASGSGFLINNEGLILTNRHVVEHGKSLLVMINGKRQRSADVVVIDDEQDLALIKVKPDEGETLPSVQLAATDTPADGAACTVMGYPLIDRLGASIKITRGVVSSASGKFAAGPDVVVDAKVNPGNSGGPILDKHGDVMAIVSMKTVASATEDTYGLGISAGRIRKFLAKNKVDLPRTTPPGADAKVLDTEEIAAKVKPAAVCILSTR